MPRKITKCLECGTQLRWLPKHLKTVHRTTWADYCKKHGLPLRRTAAQKIGAAENEAAEKPRKKWTRRPLTCIIYIELPGYDVTAIAELQRVANSIGRVESMWLDRMPSRIRVA